MFIHKKLKKMIESYINSKNINVDIKNNDMHI